jgi:hypothetical protein
VPVDEVLEVPQICSSPLAVRDARITFVRGGVAAIPTLANPALVAINHTQTAFAELATTDLSLQTALLALVIAKMRAGSPGDRTSEYPHHAHQRRYA